MSYRTHVTLCLCSIVTQINNAWTTKTIDKFPTMITLRNIMRLLYVRYHLQFLNLQFNTNVATPKTIETTALYYITVLPIVKPKKKKKNNITRSPNHLILSRC